MKFLWHVSIELPNVQHVYSHLIYPHELGYEGLQMKDDLRAHSNAVLIEGRPLDYLRLQAVVQLRHELESECLTPVSSCFGRDQL